MSVPTRMGIGLLGDSHVLIRRKFRWSFSAEFGDLKIDECFVKLNARPVLEVEEKESEINYLSAKTWIPGKASWNTITTTHFDFNTACQTAQQFFDVIRKVYAFADEQKKTVPNDYKGVGELKLYDGCGNFLESWKLNGLWPTQVNFGELDHTSSEAFDVEITWAYDSVVYTPATSSYPPPCTIPTAVQPSSPVGETDGQVEPLLGGQAE